MGLHASYHPIQQSKLVAFITDVHSEGSLREMTRFREESVKKGEEFYVGTTWHVLDFIINTPGASIPELAYAVRGHEFPSPDGSTRLEPHLASYEDEYWEAYTYVTSVEAQKIARHLTLIDDAEFRSRFVPEKMESIYRAPLEEEGNDKRYYYELLEGLQVFYQKVAAREMAVLIAVS